MSVQLCRQDCKNLKSWAGGYAKTAATIKINAAAAWHAQTRIFVSLNISFTILQQTNRTSINDNKMAPSKKRKKEKASDLIDWAKSESKQIVLDDLENGAISLDDTDKAEDLFENMYKHTPEFILEKVPFRQFRDRLRDHRKALQTRDDRIAWETACYAHDRLVYPTTTHNSRGEKKFYLTPAAALLTQDIEDGKHLRMKPSELQASRPEYQEFSRVIFDGRIRQAIRKRRMVNYMNDKRLEEEMERRMQRLNLGLPGETPWQKQQRLEQEQQDNNDD